MEHTQQRVVHANVVFGNKSENELILKAKSGDKHAFRALYDEHIGRVYALCYRLTGEKGMAVGADLKPELLLGGPGLPCCATSTARLDLVILRVDTFLHYLLLVRSRKLCIIADTGAERRSLGHQ